MALNKPSIPFLGPVNWISPLLLENLNMPFFDIVPDSVNWSPVICLQFSVIISSFLKIVPFFLKSNSLRLVMKALYFSFWYVTSKSLQNNIFSSVSR